MQNLLRNQKSRFKRLAAIIDGEHYPQVTNDALKILKNLFKGTLCGIIFIGGTEKITGSDIKEYFDSEVFVIKNFNEDFLKALDIFKPDLVYDLSDEPVVNYIKRMSIASYCFFKEASYMGSDFFFQYEKPVSSPANRSIAVIGTGKRIGKTAVSSHIAKFYKQNGIEVVVVAMGRGGPAEPLLLKGKEIDITSEYLLDLSKKGFHASSDYIEDALMSRVTTIGCRRCAGGFGGKVFFSNVEAGVKLADSLNPDLVILEGSGASIPDSQPDVNICVIGANQNWEEIAGYMGIYRILISKIVIITMCESPISTRKNIKILEDKIRMVKPDVLIFKTVFRPEPLKSIANKKIILAMTANPAIKEKIKKYMEKKFKCKVGAVTFNLSNRPLLKKDLESAGDFDAIVTELKAASVDIVTDFALSRVKEVIYMNNEPVFKGKKSEFYNGLLELYNFLKK